MMLDKFSLSISWALQFELVHVFNWRFINWIMPFDVDAEPWICNQGGELVQSTTNTNTTLFGSIRDGTTTDLRADTL